MVEDLRCILNGFFYDIVQDVIQIIIMKVKSSPVDLRQFADLRDRNFGEWFLLHQGQQGIADDILCISGTPVHGLAISFGTQNRHLFLYNYTKVFRNHTAS